MMDDLREHPAPPVEMSSNSKMLAAAAVVLGFGAIGAFAYTSGAWDGKPVAAVVKHEAAPPAVASEEPAPLPLTTAELPSAAPVQETIPPVKSVQATPTAPSATPPTRVARAQIPQPTFTPQPAQPLAPPVQETVPAPEAPAPAAAPEPPAAPVAETPAPEAPAQAAPEQPAEPAPAQ